MNKKDEQLIKQFMQTNKKEIADNGFSRKVMQQLPIPAKIWSNILTVACVISCCILFYVCDGFNLILQSIREVLQNQTLELINQPQNLRTILAVIATVVLLSIRSVWSIKD